MNVNLRAIIVLIGCGLTACTTQEAKPAGGSGGTGVGSGGTVGGGGTTGAGGGGGLALNDGVPCLPVAGPLITDFTSMVDAGTLTEPRFGVFGTSWSGGGTPYGSLTHSVAGNDWHLTGMITDFSGFNLYFDEVNATKCNRIDASAYAGVRFTIWGTLGGTNTLTMGMGTLGNAVPGSWLVAVNGVGVTGNEPGRCIPASGTQYYHPGCGDAVNTFSVTGTEASPQTVSIMWNGFTGGMPQPNVMPSEIVTIFWRVSWMAGATPYPVDIHIDNLAFIPK